MKKVKLLLTMAVIVFATMICCSMSVFALTEGDWEFQLLDNEVTITKYIGEGGNVVVPETLAGLPVTAMGYAADRGALFGEMSGEAVFNGNIKSLEINAKIKTIPYWLLSGEKELETVKLCEGIELIDNGAFARCENLKNIVLPSTVKIIATDAFNGCKSLSGLVLPEGIEQIRGGCFANSGIIEMDLTNVKFPFEKNDSDTFANCENLVRVKLSPNIEKIVDRMFINCTSLKEVVIPDGVKIIGEKAFDGCTSIENIILPTSLVEINWIAFSNTSLKEVIIPHGTKLISSEVFCDCKYLEAVYIPDTVDTMYLNPIKNCPNAIIYCSADSYAAQYCKKESLSFLTDNSVNSGIHVIYNGKRVSFHAYSQNPEVLEGRTLVPLRSIFEAMGAVVEWDGATSSAIAKRDGVEIKVQIGANEIYKNGKAIPVDVPAQIINTRTMVPARVVAEAFGADVQWNGNGRVVLITE